MAIQELVLFALAISRGGSGSGSETGSGLFETKILYNFCKFLLLMCNPDPERPKVES
jgi:hypothetical protein